MDNPFPSRRNLLKAAERYLLEPTEEQLDRAGAEPPRLTSQALKKESMSRTRERILANLDDMYREAFERAKASGDESQMATLDFAYRREQLYFEILLDVRDALERRKAGALVSWTRPRDANASRGGHSVTHSRTHCPPGFPNIEPVFSPVGRAKRGPSCRCGQRRLAPIEMASTPRITARDTRM